MKRALMVAVFALAGCGPAGGPTDGGDTDAGVTSKEFAAPTGQQFWEARWSPDGKKIAMHHSTLGPMSVDSIGVIDEGGGNLALVADAGTYLASVAWVPGGASIYFSGTAGILKVATTGGPVTLVKSAFAAMNIDVSKDGQRLTYSINGTNDVTLLELSDGGQTTIGKGEAARFSPDGTQLAYVARKTEPDGGTDEHFMLYKFSDKSVADIGVAGTYLASVCWFADNKRLALTSANGIELMSLDQTPLTRRKLIDAFASTGCDVHPDGTRILYRVNGQRGINVLSGF